jgi:hypothetical protein
MVKGVQNQLFHFQKSKIKLTASRGLTFQTRADEALTSSLEIEVGEKAPFSSTRMPLRVLADLHTKDHQVSIGCPWTTKPIVVKLSFTPPLTTTWRLHTVQHKKFVQINVTGQCDKDIYVEKPELSVGDVCKILDRNSKSSQVSRVESVTVLCHRTVIIFRWFPTVEVCRTCGSS